MNTNRFYVYEHRVKEEFELNGILYKKNTVVYIGSGTAGRFSSRKNRSDAHLLVWDKLSKIIILSNLNENQKIIEESQILSQYTNCKFIFNKRFNTYQTNNIPCDILSKNFAVDLTSPSGLKWISKRRGTRGIGKPAGGLSEFGYWRVNINGKLVMVSRIVWSLVHNKPIPENMVIDHIDRNPSNNSPCNLRCITKTDNSRNANRKTKTGVVGICWTNKDQAWKVTYSEKSMYFPCKRLSKNLQISLEDAKQIAFNMAKVYLRSLERKITEWI
jgi:hypothetical protein